MTGQIQTLNTVQDLDALPDVKFYTALPEPQIAADGTVMAVIDPNTEPK